MEYYKFICYICEQDKKEFRNEITELKLYDRSDESFIETKVCKQCTNKILLIKNQDNRYKDAEEATKRINKILMDYF